MSETLLKLCRIFIVLGLFAGSAAIAGCETSEGFGRDLQDLGSEIEDEAD